MSAVDRRCKTAAAYSVEAPDCHSVGVGLSCRRSPRRRREAGLLGAGGAPAERPFRGSRKEGGRGSARRGERTGPFRRQRDHAHRLFRGPGDASAAGKSGGGIFSVFFIIIAESSLLRKHSESVT